MRAMTIMAVVTVATWQSTAQAQVPCSCDSPALQRVQRLPAGGVPVTPALPATEIQGTVAGPKTFVAPGVTTYRQVAPPAPVASRRYYAYRPIVSLSPKLTNYHIGRGILGQPKVYVPGQPVRNFFRYVSP